MTCYYLELFFAFIALIRLSFIAYIWSIITLLEAAIWATTWAITWLEIIACNDEACIAVKLGIGPGFGGYIVTRGKA